MSRTGSRAEQQTPLPRSRPAALGTGPKERTIAKIKEGG